MHTGLVLGVNEGAKLSNTYNDTIGGFAFISRCGVSVRSRIMLAFTVVG